MSSLRAHHRAGLTPRRPGCTVAPEGADGCRDPHPGRVDALADGRALPLGGSKQRAVLAMLALRANRTVSADELIDGLWGDTAGERRQEPPALRLAAAKGAGRRTAGGEHRHPRPRLRARLAEDAVDATRFERLVEEAARESRPGANGAASAALELWRGAPLADVASEPFAGPEIGRLEELHLRAIELAIDAELAAGRHDEVIARLEELIAEEPLRERLHAQRMLALYRAGRQSEALDAYRAGARDADRADRGRARAGAANASRRRSSPRTRASTRRRRSWSCPSSSRAARRCSPAASASCAGCASAGSEARAGRVVCVLVWGPARDRQDAARGRARGRGPARGRRGALRGRRAGLRGRAGDRRRPAGAPTDAAGARLRRRRTAGGPRGRRRARARARGPAALDLRPASRRAGPARLRRPARERRRPAPAARSAGRGRDGGDRRALRPRRGRRDAAARR